MKNIAVMLRREGKQKTKLYNDVKRHDNLQGRVNYDKLEVSTLSSGQRRQLGAMKFKDQIVQRAVDVALAGERTKAKAMGRTAGSRAERYGKK